MGDLPFRLSISVGVLDTAAGLVGTAAGAVHKTL
jgi:hypothetical protein